MLVGDPFYNEVQPYPKTCSDRLQLNIIAVELHNIRAIIITVECLAMRELPFDCLLKDFDIMSTLIFSGEKKLKTCSINFSSHTLKA